MRLIEEVSVEEIQVNVWKLFIKFKKCYFLLQLPNYVLSL